MISAEEAKQKTALNAKAIATDMLNKIESKISKAIENGDYSIHIDIENNEIARIVADELTKLGYKVFMKYKCQNHQLTCDIDYITISWA